MSSITNPNPKSSSSSNSTKPRSKSSPKPPNWVNLPEEIWVVILSKLKTIDIIENAQKVCKLFRKICKQPFLYKSIDMSLPRGYAFNELPYDLNSMTRYAVDRSQGGLIDVYLEYLCDDDTFVYIVQRCKNLKHLRLAHYVYVSDEELIEAAKTLPELEGVHITICSFSYETIEDVGRACPLLKSFSLNEVGSKKPDHIYNDSALAISQSMPNLRHLQLIGNSMSNEGLKAILDGCPLLESLDLRACFHIDLSGDLGKRCEKIKCVRYPNDSTSDYGRDTCDEDAWAQLEQFTQQPFKYESDDSDYSDEFDDMFGMYPDYDSEDHDDFYPDFLGYFDFAASGGGGFPGLKAILDGCPLLESLDLRACFNIDLSGDLGKRCEKIKCVRYPNDSTADYGHDTWDEHESDDDMSSEPECDYSNYSHESDDMFGMYPNCDFEYHDDYYADFLDYFDY